MNRLLLFLLLFSSTLIINAQKKLYSVIDKKAKEVESKMIEWRRHIHENPELSNREFKTAEYIAEHLKSLGLEVQTNVAHTGVVGVLKGGKPGPVIAFRADMDGLPVTERVDIPFKSEVKSTYNNIETGVMHACGHDTHVAVQMALAEVLVSIKKDLPGTIKFIFQPAEEGAPPGEEGGAKLMVEEGVLKNPNVEAIFGLHISSGLPVNQLGYKSGGSMAAADRFVIKVKGVQTHGSQPWGGVDPVFVSAQIINGLEGIISRETELTKEAAVISVGLIRGGVRNNIIPEEVEMIGTIRTLDVEMQEKIHQKMERVVTHIAEGLGATAEITITKGVPITFNDPKLTAKILPTLQRVAGNDNVIQMDATTGAEDFSFFANEIPGLYFRLGGLPASHKKGDYIPSHHTPDFYIDDSGLITGLRAMANIAVDYLYKK
ncbi:MAG: amidohydrolase [Cyclobacteriaceae bacterium]|nr:amidohydrolase [Cyclobacteriaceae bacterium]